MVDFKGGMRRVAIVAGVVGFLFGSLYASERVRTLRSSAAQQQRFEGVTTTEALRRVQGAITRCAQGRSDAPASMRPSETDDGPLSMDQRAMVGELLSRGVAPPVNIRRFASEEIPIHAPGVMSVIADNGGRIVTVRLDSGEYLHARKADDWTEYALALTAPVIGFLVPFASVHLLLWILAGFFPQLRAGK